jgi:hypothetical protein
MALTLVNNRMNERDGLPHIPGGVSTVALFALGVGLWMWLGQSTNPNSGPVRLAGFVVVVASIAVLCEAMGLVRLGATPW